MPVTALCRSTSVLRTLAADRGLDTMLSQVALQGILFKYINKYIYIQINQLYIINIINTKRM